MKTEKYSEIAIPDGYELLPPKACQKDGDLILTSTVFTALTWQPISTRNIDMPYHGVNCGVLVIRKKTTLAGS